MKTNKIQWKRISEGEELPCDSLLMRYDGTITRGTCAGVKAGQDAYYLPIEELRTLPKEESEDERIRKELIGYFTGWSDKRLFRGFKAEQMLAWLERQGKQESVTCPICGWKIEKQGEQKPIEGEKDYRSIDPHFFKPIDKVEPMFKKGDWLVNIEYGNVVRVFDVLEDYYKLEYDGDTIGGLCIEVIDNDYRLWTIEDAKDGDVLVCDINQRPFIFKGLLDPYHPNCPVAYCGIDIEGNCYVSKHNNWWTDCNVRPATKEQRDALKKAMADAGYTFDFEKKELRKIEQKPAENEELTEFDKAVGVSIGTWNPKSPEQIQSVKAVSKKLLKLAKKQINDEQKPWSEDDLYMLKQAIRCVNNSGKLEVSTAEIEDWLKSLKERYTSKPGDLPHWKKSTLPDDNTTGFNSDFFCHRGYHINYKELFEKLPKDD